MSVECGDLHVHVVKSCCPLGCVVLSARKVSVGLSSTIVVGLGSGVTSLQVFVLLTLEM